MKEIKISTDVFARIWSLRKDGEDTENTILKRVLWSETALPIDSPRAETKALRGIVDHRYGAHFPEGFEIERTYLGTPYRAVVKERQWMIDGHDGTFTRLNELSRAIGTKVENAWVNWFYVDESGQRRPVSDLRDPSKIISRHSAEGIEEGTEEVQRNVKVKEEVMTGDKIRWCDDVRTALITLRGQASLHSIYKEVESIRRKNGRSVPKSLEATIRRTLEDFSSESENFRGEDWFCMPEGKGSGVWALRPE